MILKKHFPISWLFCWLIFFSCNSNNNVKYTSKEEQEAFQQKLLQKNKWLLENLKSIENCVSSGDLIVREGNDFTSQSLKQLNRRDKTFSHIGILSRENDSVLVYHIMGGEWNPDAKVMREPLVNFISPDNNNQFAIYQLNISEGKKKQIIKSAIELRQNDVRFDMKFDLGTIDRLYCAEYVYQCVLPVLSDTSINLSHINDFVFIGVDDIFLVPEARQIAVGNYLNKKFSFDP